MVIGDGSAKVALFVQSRAVVQEWRKLEIGAARSGIGPRVAVTQETFEAAYWTIGCSVLSTNRKRISRYDRSQLSVRNRCVIVICKETVETNV